MRLRMLFPLTFAAGLAAGGSLELVDDPEQSCSLDARFAGDSRCPEPPRRFAAPPVSRSEPGLEELENENARLEAVLEHAHTQLASLRRRLDSLEHLRRLSEVVDDGETVSVIEKAYLTRFCETDAWRNRPENDTGLSDGFPDSEQAAKASLRSWFLSDEDSRRRYDAFMEILPAVLPDGRHETFLREIQDKVVELERLRADPEYGLMPYAQLLDHDRFTWLMIKVMGLNPRLGKWRTGT